MSLTFLIPPINKSLTFPLQFPYQHFGNKIPTMQHVTLRHLACRNGRNAALRQHISTLRCKALSTLVCILSLNNLHLFLFIIARLVYSSEVDNQETKIGAKSSVLTSLSA